MNTILTIRRFDLFKLVLVSLKKLTMRDGWRPEEASYQLLAIWLYGTHSWILKMLISFDAKFRDESIAVKQYLFYKRLEPLMTIWMSTFLSWLCVFVSEEEICGERGGAQARSIGNAPECVQVLGVTILFEYVKIQTRIKTFANVRKISFISTGYWYLIFNDLISCVVPPLS